MGWTSGFPEITETSSADLLVSLEGSLSVMVLKEHFRICYYNPRKTEF